MNQTSLEKIQAAAPFLSYFRCSFPAQLQGLVRPYLDQPYQLALNVLDCCDHAQCRSADEIARQLEISKSSARQVLSVLRDEGLVYMVSHAKGWLLVEATTIAPPSGPMTLPMVAGIHSESRSELQPIGQDPPWA